MMSQGFTRVSFLRPLGKTGNWRLEVCGTLVILQLVRKTDAEIHTDGVGRLSRKSTPDSLNFNKFLDKSLITNWVSESAT